MYLSLVQVFDNHISKYMLKYNTAAWGMINHCDYFSNFTHYHLKSVSSVKKHSTTIIRLQTHASNTSMLYNCLTKMFIRIYGPLKFLFASL